LGYDSIKSDRRLDSVYALLPDSEEVGISAKAGTSCINERVPGEEWLSETVYYVPGPGYNQFQMYSF
jgi:hypothetical protein